jgi:hypothetical protein
MLTTSISTIVEVKEPLHSALQRFLDTHSEWDQDRLLNAAISLFLLQNSQTRETDAARIYLDSIFKRPTEEL